MITNLGGVTRQIQAGELRLLWQGDPSVFSAFPKVRRIADSVAGFEVTAWFGICAHKDMPTELRRPWVDAIRQAMQQEALPQRLQELGFTPHLENTADFAQRFQNDRRS